MWAMGVEFFATMLHAKSSQHCGSTGYLNHTDCDTYFMTVDFDAVKLVCQANICEVIFLW